MAIDYRYHLASIIAIFISLLLGILIGIALTPNPEQLKRIASSLGEQYTATREEKREELQKANAALAESEAVAKAAVASVITNRLAGRNIALVFNHECRRDFVDNLRGLLTQAGANVVSTTTITRNFVSMSDDLRRQVSQRLLIYPPAGTPFRATVAQAVARDLASDRPGIIASLEALGLVRASSDSSYTIRADAVLLVGGPDQTGQASPEQIDVPLIQVLQERGVRVVGCEVSTARLSSIPVYKAQGLTTVDNVDHPGGRLAVVLALAGAEGHFGTRDNADKLLPEIPAGR